MGPYLAISRECQLLTLSPKADWDLALSRPLLAVWEAPEALSASVSSWTVGRVSWGQEGNSGYHIDTTGHHDGSM